MSDITVTTPDGQASYENVQTVKVEGGALIIKHTIKGEQFEDAYSPTGWTHYGRQIVPGKVYGY